MFYKMGVELESSGNMALCCQRTDAEMSVCSASTYFSEGKIKRLLVNFVDW